jgi:hypothetical protein
VDVSVVEVMTSVPEVVVVVAVSGSVVRSSSIDVVVVELAG